MALDLGGEHGGMLAMAFAAGSTATFAFLTAIGKLLGKGKDNEIALLKQDLAKADDRYVGMSASWEQAMAEERQRCDRMEERLTARIQNLEGVMLMLAPAFLRPTVEKEIEAPTD